MQRLTKILLFLILILSLTLRVYQLDSHPPSISWDEAAVGYNGWAIANFGKDEYGKSFPFYFRSFADDKHPVHVYFTALSIKLLGLSEFSTRFPSSVFGVLNVLLIFFLARIMFKSEFLGLIAAFFLAISPYNIHFSRFSHEANFASFFFMAGLILFYVSFKKTQKLLPLSISSFAICFLTYHPSKVVVPMVIFVLITLYFNRIKTFIKNKKVVVSSSIVVIIFGLILISHPQLLGIARINQTVQRGENKLFGRIKLILTQYSWHFSPQYLFIQSDKNPRLSSQTGEFYKLDALFLILGVVYLLYKISK